MSRPDVDVAHELGRLYRRNGRRTWAPGTRCDCDKIGYSSEQAALSAAERQQDDLGLPFRVYKCPGTSRWHTSSRGFHPRALRSRPRVLAWYITVRGATTEDYLYDELGVTRWGDSRGERRKAEVIARILRIFAGLGLVALDDPKPGYVSAADREGLARVMTAGLEQYAAERGVFPARAPD